MRILDDFIRADVWTPVHKLGKPLGRAQPRDHTPGVTLGTGTKGAELFQLLLSHDPGLIHVLALSKQTDFGLVNVRAIQHLGMR